VMEWWSIGEMKGPMKSNLGSWLFPTLRHSNSAVVARGYYGEVGYSSTPKQLALAHSKQ
jgi:hypothetical protein